MMKSPKSNAEKHFAATQKKSDLFLKEKEKAVKERADRTARLRALRLAKEAADSASEEVTSKASSSVKAAPESATEDIAGPKLQAASDKDGETDPLAIPPFLRRQGH
jgi:hypothetical protein